jgi:hypothetical protein
MAATLERNYDRLTPRERLRLVMDALGREDLAEASRLRRSCPLKAYRTWGPATPRVRICRGGPVRPGRLNRLPDDESILTLAWNDRRPKMSEQATGRA